MDHGRAADPAGLDPGADHVCHRHPDEQGDDPALGGAAGGLLRPFRFRAGELFRHCGHQGLCQGIQGTAGFPEAEQGKRGDQRDLHEDRHPAGGAGDPVRGVRGLHHSGLRRLSGLSGPVQRRPAGGVHRLL